MRNVLFHGSWFMVNAIAIGLLAFSDIIWIRLVGWLWLSIAMSMASLVVVSGVAYLSKEDSPRDRKCFPWSHQWAMWQPSEGGLYQCRKCVKCGVTKEKSIGTFL
jgi:hypothetical protein